MQPLAAMTTGIEFVARARSCGEGAEVGIDRLEERGGHLAVVPREQHALEADVRALELVLTVRFDPRMKRHGSPEDLGQPFGGDPLDDRQNHGGGVGRVHQEDAAVLTGSGPGPDSRSRSISWIARSIASEAPALSFSARPRAT